MVRPRLNLAHASRPHHRLLSAGTGDRQITAGSCARDDVGRRLLGELFCRNILW
jgi:hypothetical protein